MIDIASEQRCVVVIADAFVIVLGLQMFTKLLHFNPCNGLIFSGKGLCSVNTCIQICFTLPPCQHLIHEGIQLSSVKLVLSFRRILHEMNDEEERHASYCQKFLYLSQSSFLGGKQWPL